MVEGGQSISLPVPMGLMGEAEEQVLLERMGEGFLATREETMERVRSVVEGD